MTKEEPQSLWGGLRPLLGYIAAFSFFINLLFLVPAFFTLQVFDRVISSNSRETLIVLLAGTGVALLILMLLDYVRTRLLSFGLVLSIGFLLLVSLVVSAVLSALGDMLMPGSQFMARAGEFVTSFAVLTLLFAMIYKLLPSRRIEWRDVWVGAAVTSLLFWVGKFAIGLYIAKSSVASSFGAAGTVVVIIAWVYYSSLIFFFGAEFTREYAVLHGSKRDSKTLEEPLEGEVIAANDEHHLLDRAKAIVTGKDPILTRKEQA